MKNIGIIILLFCVIGCSSVVEQNEFKKIKAELATAKSEIENLKLQIEPEGDLVHLVLFKTKPDADFIALGKEIEKMEAIAVIKDLQYGAFENLGDERALSDYQMIIEMLSLIHI